MGVIPKYYPGTHVFINKLGIKSAADLSKAEADITFLRFQHCLSTPPGLLSFDLSHLQLIHHCLFQDIYDWAGKLRGYHMRKDICVFTPHRTDRCQSKRYLFQVAYRRVADGPEQTGIYSTLGRILRLDEPHSPFSRRQRQSTKTILSTTG